MNIKSHRAYKGVPYLCQNQDKEIIFLLQNKSFVITPLL